MSPTVDSFLALARSSPWRWTTLHFRHRSDAIGECEAWVQRPGELLVRRADGTTRRESGLPYTRVVFTASSDGATRTDQPGPRPPQLVRPALRDDGLVAERPDGLQVNYDDPMYGNYSWVAMLDPVELSHHVEVRGLREEEVAGRRAWRADLRALPGYRPRCGGNCCELLYSEAGLYSDFDHDHDEVPAHWRGRGYPDHYDVALDVQTGVVVRCLPVGGPDDAPRLENDILEVDADLGALFG